MIKFHSILTVLFMAAFGGLYLYMYKSISKEAVMAILFLGILSLLSFRVSDDELEKYLSALKDIRI